MEKVNVSLDALDSYLPAAQWEAVQEDSCALLRDLTRLERRLIVLRKMGSGRKARRFPKFQVTELDTNPKPNPKPATWDADKKIK